MRNHISGVYNKGRFRNAAPKAVVLGLLCLVSVAIPSRAQDDRAIVSRVKPVYPELAKRMKITGAVLLNVVVMKDGTVKSASTVMGESVLATAAKEAVMKWKFAPDEFETTEQVELKFNPQ